MHDSIRIPRFYPLRPSLLCPKGRREHISGYLTCCTLWHFCFETKSISPSFRFNTVSERIWHSAKRIHCLCQSECSAALEHEFPSTSHITESAARPSWGKNTAQVHFLPTIEDFGDSLNNPPYHWNYHWKKQKIKHKPTFRLQTWKARQ